ncbi:hypothetical protein PTSG_11794 [Salpingoeca rosetta]|uniref:Uncharacterized protein n=1 Tax=Salpingoeca rosetta (strain ATCC 50818 / BSB-021) TaxID=946362 RepID=F2TZ64_SALR5|nr:uncharacterized protein PTSG_11794 [Salpingoeca rosetta]EGD78888.1 hypothetical protein PTSG_11794 [Salpingoeca rosetta]|eukprot:XP_004997844.1 hypothetical protein PTSG_11794 [Salpingoeca rosetta]
MDNAAVGGGSLLPVVAQSHQPADSQRHGATWAEIAARGGSDGGDAGASSSLQHNRKHPQRQHQPQQQQQQQQQQRQRHGGPTAQVNADAAEGVGQRTCGSVNRKGAAMAWLFLHLPAVVATCALAACASEHPAFRIALCVPLLDGIIGALGGERVTLHAHLDQWCIGTRLAAVPQFLRQAGTHGPVAVARSGWPAYMRPCTCNAILALLALLVHSACASSIAAPWLTQASAAAVLALTSIVAQQPRLLVQLEQGYGVAPLQLLQVAPLTWLAFLGLNAACAAVHQHPSATAPAQPAGLISFSFTIALVSVLLQRLACTNTTSATLHTQADDAADSFTGAAAATTAAVTVAKAATATPSASAVATGKAGGTRRRRNARQQTSSNSAGGEDSGGSHARMRIHGQRRQRFDNSPSQHRAVFTDDGRDLEGAWIVWADVAFHFVLEAVAAVTALLDTTQIVSAPATLALFALWTVCVAASMLALVPAQHIHTAASLLHMRDPPTLLVLIRWWWWLGTSALLVAACTALPQLLCHVITHPLRAVAFALVVVPPLITCTRRTSGGGGGDGGCGGDRGAGGDGDDGAGEAEGPSVKTGLFDDKSMLADGPSLPFDRHDIEAANPSSLYARVVASIHGARRWVTRVRVSFKTALRKFRARASAAMATLCVRVGVPAAAAARGINVVVGGRGGAGGGGNNAAVALVLYTTAGAVCTVHDTIGGSLHVLSVAALVCVAMCAVTILLVTSRLPTATPNAAAATWRRMVAQTTRTVTAVAVLTLFVYIGTSAQGGRRGDSDTSGPATETAHLAWSARLSLIIAAANILTIFGPLVSASSASTSTAPEPVVVAAFACLQAALLAYDPSSSGSGAVIAAAIHCMHCTVVSLVVAPYLLMGGSGGNDGSDGGSSRSSEKLMSINAMLPHHAALHSLLVPTWLQRHEGARRHDDQGVAAAEAAWPDVADPATSASTTTTTFGATKAGARSGLRKGFHRAWRVLKTGWLRVLVGPEAVEFTAAIVLWPLMDRHTATHSTNSNSDNSNNSSNSGGGIAVTRTAAAAAAAVTGGRGWGEGAGGSHGSGNGAKDDVVVVVPIGETSTNEGDSGGGDGVSTTAFFGSRYRRVAVLLVHACAVGGALASVCALQSPKHVVRVWMAVAAALFPLHLRSSLPSSARKRVPLVHIAASVAGVLLPHVVMKGQPFCFTSAPCSTASAVLISLATTSMQLMGALPSVADVLTTHALRLPLFEAALARLTACCIMTAILLETWPLIPFHVASIILNGCFTALLQSGVVTAGACMCALLWIGTAAFAPLASQAQRLAQSILGVAVLLYPLFKAVYIVIVVAAAFYDDVFLDLSDAWWLAVSHRAYALMALPSTLLALRPELHACALHFGLARQHTSSRYQVQMTEECCHVFMRIKMDYVYHLPALFLLYVICDERQLRELYALLLCWYAFATWRHASGLSP